MNKKTLTAAAMLLSVAFLSGCVSKRVMNRFSDSTLLAVVEQGEEKPFVAGWAARKELGWTPEVENYRWVVFGFRSSLYGDFVVAPALVPDQIAGPVSEGALVKVETGDLKDFNLAEQKGPRVVELVCKAGDKPCIEEMRKKYGFRAYELLGPAGMVSQEGFTFTPRKPQ